MASAMPKISEEIITPGSGTTSPASLAVYRAACTAQQAIAEQGRRTCPMTRCGKLRRDRNIH